MKFRALYRGKMYNNVIVKPDGVVEIIRREGNVHTDQTKAQLLLEYEPMHSCQDVTDEPCDACICEEEEVKEIPQFEGTREALDNIKI